MSRTVVNFWLDTLMFICFSSLVWCATVLRFVFPPGPEARDWSLWGWSYVRWFDFQYLLLCVMVLLVLLHVMLHWSWVCGIVTVKLLPKTDQWKRRWDDGQRTLAGVGLLIVLLNVMGIGLAVAALMVREPTSWP
ncbi:MAG: hypothetical protein WBF93_16445 [Pirellulales bacterium]|nr:hypothetical protein [Pirellulales bacterium]